MGMKVDLSGVKSFFFERGEKVGMIACAVVGLGLFGYGIVGGFGAKSAPGGKSYPDAIKTEVASIQSKLSEGSEVEDFPDPTPKDGIEWKAIRLPFKQGQMFTHTESQHTKRTNPRALAALADAEGKHIQMDYIRGTIFAYDVNLQKQTATVVKDAMQMKDFKKPGFPLQKQPPMPKGMQGMNAQEPLTTVQPVRMLVVNAVFPMRDQINEFRKAFRMMHEGELFLTPQDLPRVVGMNVWKTEVVPGQPSQWKPLVVNNFEADRLEVDPALMSILREAKFDEEPSLLSHAMVQGLVMPLPSLTPLTNSGSYPKVELAGIEPAEEGMGNPGVPGPRPPMQGGGRGGPGRPMPAPGGMPRPGGGGGAEAELETISWKRLAPQLIEKFTGQFYALDPDGMFPDPDEGKDPANAQIRQPVPQQGFGQQLPPFYKSPSIYSSTQFWSRFPPTPLPADFVPMGANQPVPNPRGVPLARPQPGPVAGNVGMKPYDALIRFFDADVRPGKTYKYKIQVRLANPNEGKKTDVAFAALADIKELKPAEAVETPTYTIPGEYELYAVDQKPENPKVINGSDDREAKADEVAIQIHKWVDQTTDSTTGANHAIGDWVIAERILLRRGDPVGRTVNVEIPVWDKVRQTYELGSAQIGQAFGPIPKAKDKKFGPKGFELPPKDLGRPRPPVPPAPGMLPGTMPAMNDVGIPINFAETTPPAILVDFDGGKRSFKAGATTVSDDSASNLLILTSDGRLIVRNTRTDSDGDSPEAKTRLDRINAWKEKVEAFRLTDGANPARPQVAPTPGNNNPFQFRRN